MTLAINVWPDVPANPEAPPFRIQMAVARVSCRVYFREEKMPYTVQARDQDWIICTKPFAAHQTVIYSIINLHTGMRGPDDRVFGQGYETREECEQRLRDFQQGMGLSYRRRCPAYVMKILEPTG